MHKKQVMGKENKIVVVCRTLFVLVMGLLALSSISRGVAVFAGDDNNNDSWSVATVAEEVTTGTISVVSTSSGETTGGSLSGGLSAQESVSQTVVQGLQYGDIQIVEVFPSSGSCLDEFVKIHFGVSYSGFISVYGLGTSAGIVTVWVDQQAGSDLVVTDNVAGAIPGSHLLLVGTVTLTNGGELLKVLVSGQVLDEVYYSNLQGAQSLYFTSLSGSTRLFTSNGSASVPTSCGSTPLVQVLGSGGGCDIRADVVQYLGTGLYNLSLQAVGQYTTGCRTDVGAYGEWSINGSLRHEGGCATTVPLSIGVSTIEFKRYEGGQIRCRDQLIFASQYDVGIVKQYVSSPGSLSCAAPITQEELRFVVSDCGLKMQGSRLGFFASNSFNIVTTVGGKDIYNSSAQYTCKIDMGDGTILDQCNPPAYRYASPGVYDVVLDVYDVHNQQSVCRVRSFVNVPPKSYSSTWEYDQLRILQTEVLQYCSASDISQEQENMEKVFPRALCELAQQTGSVVAANVSGDQYIVTSTGIQRLSLYSVLPNPIGSDSLYESVILLYTGGSDLSLSDYALMVKDKTISLSGTVFASGLHELVGGWGLRNDGMCIGLKYLGASIDTLCYGAVKEGEVVVRSGYNQAVQFVATAKTVTKKQTTSAKSKTTSKELSCTEKLKIAKTSEKEKYKKLRQTRQKEKLSYQQQLSKWKTKELLARNKQYLYKNMNNLIASDIKTDRPDVWVDAGLSSYLAYADVLAQRIDQGYMYTSKNRTPTGWRYEYTNDIKKYIHKQQQVSALDVLVPYFSDYIDNLYYYQINSKTIAAVNGL